jgi:hypothetical protein
MCQKAVDTKTGCELARINKQWESCQTKKTWTQHPILLNYSSFHFTIILITLNANN